MQKQTVKELKAMAKAKKIKGYYKMKKAELIAALGEGAPEAKEVKAPKKKIIKIKKSAPKEEPKKEPAKKKPIMTKARLRELRKTKPKYPPPPPPSAKKKAVPAKKKIVKKGKAPVKQSGLVIDAAAQAKAEAEGKRIIIDMSGDKPVQRLVKKGKPLKKKGKNFNYRGESAPEFKDADFSNVNMFLRTGRKDYLRNMK